MNEAHIARAIRRALLVSLTLPVGALSACGGRTNGADESDAALGSPDTGDVGPVRLVDGGPPADAESAFDASIPPDGSIDFTDAAIADAFGDAFGDGSGDAYSNPGCYTEIVDGSSPCTAQVLHGDPASCEYGSDGAPTTRQCAALCGQGFLGCSIQRGADGAPNQVECSCGGGRAPAGLAAPVLASETELGAHFARMAHLEAAATLAFAILERELVLHDAPAELVEASRRAVGDEVRHAKSMGAIARRFGASVPAVDAAPPRVRSLEEIAIENAVEGCVRESYGAAVAAYQGEVAGDPAVRRAMRSIAKDERRHAALGWAVSTWAESRLDEAARARVRAARNDAVNALANEVARELPSPLIETAGLPTPARAARLVASLRAELWS